MRRERYGSEPGQQADLLLPRGRSAARVVVLVHGGSWGGGFSKAVMLGLALDLVRRGFAVWNVEYRRVGHDGGGWPQTGDDVAAAVRFLPSLGEPRLALDDGVVLLGHSAGGQLVLRAAARDDLGVPLSLVVSMAGVASMTDGQRRWRTEPSAITKLLGGGPDAVPDVYADADPIRHVPPSAPVLLVHGTDDTTVGVFHSRDYLAACRAAGGTAELIEVAGRAGAHRQHVTPWGPTWRPVVARLGTV